MSEYRWNQSEMAAGYDAGALLVHPYYAAVQDAILDRLPFTETDEATIVDLGGGSGRLLERVLERWLSVTGVVVDQSSAFLDLAASRLERFVGRVTFVCRRLQEDWRAELPAEVAAIVSTSAIHHLDPVEKQECYRRCFEVLRPGGILLNGDEVRPESDSEYRQIVERWAAHMQRLIASKAVTPAMADGLQQWKRRNVDQFDQPTSSGDDCHESAATQLGYFEAAGLVDVETVWSRELWTVLFGRKPL